MKKKVVISSNSAVGSSLGSSSSREKPPADTITNRKVPDWIKFSNILCKYDGSCTRDGCWYRHTKPRNNDQECVFDDDGSVQDFSVFMKNMPLCTTFDERLDLSNYLRAIAKSFGHVTKCLVHIPRDRAKSSTGNIHFKSSVSATDFIDYIHLKYINGYTFHARWNGACKYCISDDIATSDPSVDAISSLEAPTTPITLRSLRIKKVVQDSDGFCLTGRRGKKMVLSDNESDSDGPESLQ